jgi:hypothetical protein
VTISCDRGRRAVTGGRRQLGNPVLTDVARCEDSGYAGPNEDVGDDVARLVEIYDARQEAWIGFKTDLNEDAAEILQPRIARIYLAQPDCRNNIVAQDLLDGAVRKNSTFATFPALSRMLFWGSRMLATNWRAHGQSLAWEFHPGFRLESCALISARAEEEIRTPDPLLGNYPDAMQAAFVSGRPFWAC